MTRPPRSRPFKAGDLVLFTSGEYSDQQNDGLLRAKVDGDLGPLYRRMKAETGKRTSFINWLTNVEKAFDEVEYSEAHEQDYGHGSYGTDPG